MDEIILAGGGLDLGRAFVALGSSPNSVQRPNVRACVLPKSNFIIAQVCPFLNLSIGRASLGPSYTSGSLYVGMCEKLAAGIDSIPHVHPRHAKRLQHPGPVYLRQGSTASLPAAASLPYN